jgi:hypothetical protein
VQCTVGPLITRSGLRDDYVCVRECIVGPLITRSGLRDDYVCVRECIVGPLITRSGLRDDYVCVCTPHVSCVMCLLAELRSKVVL